LPISFASIGCDAVEELFVEQHIPDLSQFCSSMLLVSVDVFNGLSASNLHQDNAETVDIIRFLGV